MALALKKKRPCLEVLEIISSDRSTDRTDSNSSSSEEFLEASDPDSVHDIVVVSRSTNIEH